jgi:integrase
MAARRSYSTGSLYVRKDGKGRETWYGRWRVGERRVNRKLGPKRMDGARDGLTKRQAEGELRRLMQSATVAAPLERMMLEEAGERLVRHRRTMGRKKSTLDDYESYLEQHLVPFFHKPLHKIAARDVEMFISAKLEQGKARKSILNWLGLLHSVFEHAIKQGWVSANPCKGVEKPREEPNQDIRFLTQEELEAVLRAVPDDVLGPTEGVMYLAAAMTGMRQGELRGLRWSDVDWLAGRVRVRRNYVRGEYGTPKSRRSSRSVPLATRLATELEHHYQRSAYQADDDLVFPHPQTGHPLDGSKLLKRFKTTLTRAKLRRARLHDLRHSFGTQMAAAGIPMRTLQEWMGHRDIKTTLIYADYAPSAHEAEFIERAFGSSVHSSDHSEQTSHDLSQPETA